MDIIKINSMLLTHSFHAFLDRGIIIEYNKWNLSDFQSHHPLRLLLMHFDYINYEEEVITLSLIHI